MTEEEIQKQITEIVQTIPEGLVQQVQGESRNIGIEMRQSLQAYLENLVSDNKGVEIHHQGNQLVLVFDAGQPIVSLDAGELHEKNPSLSDYLNITLAQKKADQEISISFERDEEVTTESTSKPKKMKSQISNTKRIVAFGEAKFSLIENCDDLDLQGSSHADKVVKVPAINVTEHSQVNALSIDTADKVSIEHNGNIGLIEGDTIGSLMISERFFNPDPNTQALISVRNVVKIEAATYPKNATIIFDSKTPIPEGKNTDAIFQLDGSTPLENLQSIKEFTPLDEEAKSVPLPVSTSEYKAVKINDRDIVVVKVKNGKGDTAYTFLEKVTTDDGKSEMRLVSAYRKGDENQMKRTKGKLGISKKFSFEPRLPEEQKKVIDKVVGTLPQQETTIKEPLQEILEKAAKEQEAEFLFEGNQLVVIFNHEQSAGTIVRLQRELGELYKTNEGISDSLSIALVQKQRPPSKAQTNISLKQMEEEEGKIETQVSNAKVVVGLGKTHFSEIKDCEQVLLQNDSFVKEVTGKVTRVLNVSDNVHVENVDSVQQVTMTGGVIDMLEYLTETVKLSNNSHIKFIKIAASIQIEGQAVIDEIKERVGFITQKGSECRIGKITNVGEVDATQENNGIITADTIGKLSIGKEEAVSIRARSRYTALVSANSIKQVEFVTSHPETTAVIFDSKTPIPEGKNTDVIFQLDKSTSLESLQSIKEFTPLDEEAQSITLPASTSEHKAIKINGKDIVIVKVQNGKGDTAYAFLEKVTTEDGKSEMRLVSAYRKGDREQETKTKKILGFEKNFVFEDTIIQVDEKATTGKNAIEQALQHAGNTETRESIKNILTSSKEAALQGDQLVVILENQDDINKLQQYSETLNNESSGVNLTVITPLKKASSQVSFESEEGQGVKVKISNAAEVLTFGKAHISKIESCEREIKLQGQTRVDEISDVRETDSELKLSINGESSVSHLEKKLANINISGNGRLEKANVKISTVTLSDNAFIGRLDGTSIKYKDIHDDNSNIQAFIPANISETEITNPNSSVVIGLEEARSTELKDSGHVIFWLKDKIVSNIESVEDSSFDTVKDNLVTLPSSFTEPKFYTLKNGKKIAIIKMRDERGDTAYAFFEKTTTTNGEPKIRLVATCRDGNNAQIEQAKARLGLEEQVYFSERVIQADEEALRKKDAIQKAIDEAKSKAQSNANMEALDTLSNVLTSAKKELVDAVYQDGQLVVVLNNQELHKKISPVAGGIPDLNFTAVLQTADSIPQVQFVEGKNNAISVSGTETVFATGNVNLDTITNTKKVALHGDAKAETVDIVGVNGELILRDNSSVQEAQAEEIDVGKGCYIKNVKKAKQLTVKSGAYIQSSGTVSNLTIQSGIVGQVQKGSLAIQGKSQSLVTGQVKFKSLGHRSIIILDHDINLSEIKIKNEDVLFQLDEEVSTQKLSNIAEAEFKPLESNNIILPSPNNKYTAFKINGRNIIAVKVQDGNMHLAYAVFEKNETVIYLVGAFRAKDENISKEREMSSIREKLGIEEQIQFKERLIQIEGEVLRDEEAISSVLKNIKDEQTRQSVENQLKELTENAAEVIYQNGQLIAVTRERVMAGGGSTIDKLSKQIESTNANFGFSIVQIAEGVLPQISVKQTQEGQKIRISSVEKVATAGKARIFEISNCDDTVLQGNTEVERISSTININLKDNSKVSIVEGKVDADGQNESDVRLHDSARIETVVNAQDIWAHGTSIIGRVKGANVDKITTYDNSQILVTYEVKTVSQLSSENNSIVIFEKNNKSRTQSGDSFVTYVDIKTTPSDTNLVKAEDFSFPTEYFEPTGVELENGRKIIIAKTAGKYNKGAIGFFERTTDENGATELRLIAAYRDGDEEQQTRALQELKTAGLDLRQIEVQRAEKLLQQMPKPLHYIGTKHRTGLFRKEVVEWDKRDENKENPSTQWKFRVFDVPDISLHAILNPENEAKPYVLQMNIDIPSPKQTIGVVIIPKNTNVAKTLLPKPTIGQNGVIVQMPQEVFKTIFGQKITKVSYKIENTNAAEIGIRIKNEYGEVKTYYLHKTQTENNETLFIAEEDQELRFALNLTVSPPPPPTPSEEPSPSPEEPPPQPTPSQVEPEVKIPEETLEEGAPPFEAVVERAKPAPETELDKLKKELEKIKPILDEEYQNRRAELEKEFETIKGGDLNNPEMAAKLAHAYKQAIELALFHEDQENQGKPVVVRVIQEIEDTARTEGYDGQEAVESAIRYVLGLKNGKVSDEDISKVTRSYGFAFYPNRNKSIRKLTDAASYPNFNEFNLLSEVKEFYSEHSYLSPEMLQKFYIGKLFTQYDYYHQKKSDKLQAATLHNLASIASIDSLTPDERALLESKVKETVEIDRQIREAETALIKGPQITHFTSIKQEMSEQGTGLLEKLPKIGKHQEKQFTYIYKEIEQASESTKDVPKFEFKIIKTPESETGPFKLEINISNLQNTTDQKVVVIPKSKSEETELPPVDKAGEKLTRIVLPDNVFEQAFKTDDGSLPAQVSFKIQAIKLRDITIKTEKGGHMVSRTSLQNSYKPIHGEDFFVMARGEYKLQQAPNVTITTEFKSPPPPPPPVEEGAPPTPVAETTIGKEAKIISDRKEILEDIDKRLQEAGVEHEAIQTEIQGINRLLDKISELNESEEKPVLYYNKETGQLVVEGKQLLFFNSEIENEISKQIQNTSITVVTGEGVGKEQTPERYFTKNAEGESVIHFDTVKSRVYNINALAEIDTVAIGSFTRIANYGHTKVNIQTMEGGKIVGFDTSVLHITTVKGGEVWGHDTSVLHIATMKDGIVRGSDTSILDIITMEGGEVGGTDTSVLHITIMEGGKVNGFKTSTLHITTVKGGKIVGFDTSVFHITTMEDGEVRGRNTSVLHITTVKDGEVNGLDTSVTHITTMEGGKVVSLQKSTWLIENKGEAVEEIFYKGGDLEFKGIYLEFKHNPHVEDVESKIVEAGERRFAVVKGYNKKDNNSPVYSVFEVVKAEDGKDRLVLVGAVKESDIKRDEIKTWFIRNLNTRLGLGENNLSADIFENAVDLSDSSSIEEAAPVEEPIEEAAPPADAATSKIIKATGVENIDQVLNQVLIPDGEKREIRSLLETFGDGLEEIRYDHGYLIVNFVKTELQDERYWHPEIFSKLKDSKILIFVHGPQETGSQQTPSITFKKEADEIITAVIAEQINTTSIIVNGRIKFSENADIVTTFGEADVTIQGNVNTITSENDSKVKVNGVAKEVGQGSTKLMEIGTVGKRLTFLKPHSAVLTNKVASGTVITRTEGVSLDDIALIATSFDEVALNGEFRNGVDSSLFFYDVDSLREVVDKGNLKFEELDNLNVILPLPTEQKAYSLLGTDFVIAHIKNTAKDTTKNTSAYIIAVKDKDTGELRITEAFNANDTKHTEIVKKNIGLANAEFIMPELSLPPLSPEEIQKEKDAIKHELRNLLKPTSSPELTPKERKRKLQDIRRRALRITLFQPDPDNTNIPICKTYIDNLGTQDIKPADKSELILQLQELHSNNSSISLENPGNILNGYFEYSPDDDQVMNYLALIASSQEYRSHYRALLIADNNQHAFELIDSQKTLTPDQLIEIYESVFKNAATTTEPKSEHIMDSLAALISIKTKQHSGMLQELPDRAKLIRGVRGTRAVYKSIKTVPGSQAVFEAIFGRLWITKAVGNNEIRPLYQEGAGLVVYVSRNEYRHWDEEKRHKVEQAITSSKGKITLVLGTRDIFFDNSMNKVIIKEPKVIVSQNSNIEVINSYNLQSVTLSGSSLQTGKVQQVKLTNGAYLTVENAENIQVLQNTPDSPPVTVHAEDVDTLTTDNQSIASIHVGRVKSKISLDGQVSCHVENIEAGSVSVSNQAKLEIDRIYKGDITLTGNASPSESLKAHSWRGANFIKGNGVIVDIKIQGAEITTGDSIRTENVTIAKKGYSQGKFNLQNNSVLINALVNENGNLLLHNTSKAHGVHVNSRGFVEVRDDSTFSGKFANRAQLSILGHAKVYAYQKGVDKITFYKKKDNKNDISALLYHLNPDMITSKNAFNSEGLLQDEYIEQLIENAETLSVQGNETSIDYEGTEIKVFRLKQTGEEQLYAVLPATKLHYNSKDKFKKIKKTAENGFIVAKVKKVTTTDNEGKLVSKYVFVDETFTSEKEIGKIQLSSDSLTLNINVQSPTSTVSEKTPQQQEAVTESYPPSNLETLSDREEILEDIEKRLQKAGIENGARQIEMQGINRLLDKIGELNESEEKPVLYYNKETGQLVIENKKDPSLYKIIRDEISKQVQNTSITVVTGENIGKQTPERYFTKNTKGKSVIHFDTVEDMNVYNINALVEIDAVKADIYNFGYAIVNIQTMEGGEIWGYDASVLFITTMEGGEVGGSDISSSNITTMKSGKVANLNTSVSHITTMEDGIVWGSNTSILDIITMEGGKVVGRNTSILDIITMEGGEVGGSDTSVTHITIMEDGEVWGYDTAVLHITTMEDGIVDSHNTSVFDIKTMKGGKVVSRNTSVTHITTMEGGKVVSLQKSTWLIENKGEAVEEIFYKGGDLEFKGIYLEFKHNPHVEDVESKIVEAGERRFAVVKGYNKKDNNSPVYSVFEVVKAEDGKDRLVLIGAVEEQDVKQDKTKTQFIQNLNTRLGLGENNLSIEDIFENAVDLSGLSPAEETVPVATQDRKTIAENEIVTVNKNTEVETVEGVLRCEKDLEVQVETNKGEIAASAGTVNITDNIGTVQATNNATVHIEHNETINGKTTVIGKVIGKDKGKIYVHNNEANIEVEGQSRAFIENHRYLQVNASGNSVAVIKEVSNDANATVKETATLTVMTQSKETTSVKAYQQSTIYAVEQTDKAKLNVVGPDVVCFVSDLDKISVNLENRQRGFEFEPASSSQIYSFGKEVTIENTRDAGRIEVGGKKFVVVEARNKDNEKAYGVFEVVKGEDNQDTLVLIDGRRSNDMDNLVERLQAKTDLEFTQEQIENNAFSSLLPLQEKEVVEEEAPEIVQTTGVDAEIIFKAGEFTEDKASVVENYLEQHGVDKEKVAGVIEGLRTFNEKDEISVMYKDNQLVVVTTNGYDNLTYYGRVFIDAFQKSNINIGFTVIKKQTGEKTQDPTIAFKEVFDSNGKKQTVVSVENADEVRTHGKGKIERIKEINRAVVLYDSSQAGEIREVGEVHLNNSSQAGEIREVGEVHLNNSSQAGEIRNAANVSVSDYSQIKGIVEDVLVSIKYHLNINQYTPLTIEGDETGTQINILTKYAQGLVTGGAIENITGLEKYKPLIILNQGVGDNNIENKEELFTLTEQTAVERLVEVEEQEFESIEGAISIPSSAGEYKAVRIQGEDGKIRNMLVVRVKNGNDEEAIAFIEQVKVTGEDGKIRKEVRLRGAYRINEQGNAVNEDEVGYIREKFGLGDDVRFMLLVKPTKITFTRRRKSLSTVEKDLKTSIDWFIKDRNIVGMSESAEKVLIKLLTESTVNIELLYRNGQLVIVGDNIKHDQDLHKKLERELHGRSLGLTLVENKKDKNAGSPVVEFEKVVGGMQTLVSVDNAEKVWSYGKIK